MNKKIGIAYSVHNRIETAQRCIAECRKHTPDDFEFVIVDDGSSVPFPNATFRFEPAQGISHAKNKCIELLMGAGCTDMFLFDDDTFAKVDNWWEPYVNSTEKHLMFTFSRLKDGRQNGNRQIISQNGLTQYFNPCGCLLYVTRDVIDKVGGFDTRFERYSHEHVEWSNRIHNAGLTKYRYQDVPNSLELFHSMDWACEIKSSVTSNRGAYISANSKHFNKVRNSSAFIPYKQLEDVVITTYFTSVSDPQRGSRWNPERLPNDVYDLANSCKERGIKLVILTDFDTPIGINIGAPKTNNPYTARWHAIQEYLYTHEHRFVLCVDATDVQILRNPFPHLDYDKLYLGDEQCQRIANQWLIKHHPAFADMYRGIPNRPLLNAGVCGGAQRIVQGFVSRILQTFTEREPGLTDMAAYNYTAYKYLSPIIVHGEQVTTKFKAYRDNGKAWIMHK